MKQLFVFCILLTTFCQAATSGPFEDQIAYELDLVFSDTVNEGDLKASVAYKNASPELSCVVTFDVARCEAIIEVTMLASTTQRSCRKKCSVIYTMKGLEREPTSGYECLRIINEGC